MSAEYPSRATEWQGSGGASGIAFHLAPWTTLLAVATLVVHFQPIVTESVGAPALLEYERAAVVSGQWWRLATGHLLHWSFGHLLLDLSAVVIIGGVLERMVRERYPTLLLGIAGTIGVSLCVFQPDVLVYRGLSGVASGLFAALLVMGLRRLKRFDEWGAMLMIVALFFLTKIGYEGLTGELFLATGTVGDIGDPVTLAHVSGALAGAVFASVIALPIGESPQRIDQRAVS
ncbi:Rhomboid family protein [Planctomycetes bacterium Pan216]|uniref:Rhomboid family protein n=1 Tax=Kolteria novifilia TaxID=2527975 RepID=A0A518AX06_9BACT|nr:Rhomboid family protein [Planctomycetes bacterium Pan216]